MSDEAMAEDLESTDEASQLEQLDSDICDRLRSLDLSQQSIETESEFLLRVRLPACANATFLAEIVTRFILRSHRWKKLPYVYLANDLIQKSMMERKKADQALV